MLLEAEEENAALKKENESLRESLEDRRIRVEKCGNLAEASLELSGVFLSAQAACQQYVDNVRALNAETEEICRRLEREAEEKCRDMERETEEKCRAKEEQTGARCEKMISDIRAKCDQYWNIVSGEIGVDLSGEKKEQDSVELREIDRKAE